MLEGTLYLPVWGNSSVAAVARDSRARALSSVPLRARPTAALVYHRQRQPLGEGALPSELFNWFYFNSI